MILYLAGLRKTPKRMTDWVLETYPTMGRLLSFILAKSEFEYAFSLPLTVPIMIDSGAFSVKNSGKEVDINSLGDFYRDAAIHRPNVTCVSLDVMRDQNRGWDSVRNWDYLREKKGVMAMPVYHADEDIEVLDYYVRDCEYVGIGGVADRKADWQQLIPLIRPAFLRYPEHKFHLFGINSIKVISRLPAFSADALTWRSGSRFGIILTPEGGCRIGRVVANVEEDPNCAHFDILPWLKKNNVPYPFPEGYDWTELDKINIRILNDVLVNNHTRDIFDQSSTMLTIF